MLIDASLYGESQPRLMSIAYRMLGSVTEAEDVVQEAFLRYQTTEAVQSPEGFLVRVTTRLCLDQLRKARRDTYVGPWVPEPVKTGDVDQNLALADSLTQAFLLLLERLSPDERAAFLLRTVFDYDYRQLAEILDKSEASVRQLVSRARLRLEEGALRARPTLADARRMADHFLVACRQGDLAQLKELFAQDVAVHSDGGGRVSAARVVLEGRDKAARFLAGVFRKWGPHCAITPTTVNGAPGLEFSAKGETVLILSLAVQDAIQAIYLVVNPEKLRRWSLAQIE